jgi:hypothetical protein
MGYDARNRAIWRKYNQASTSHAACTPGRVQELAAEYGMTWRQVYSILAAVREQDAANAAARAIDSSRVTA